MDSLAHFNGYLVNMFYGKLRQICVSSSNCTLGYYTGTLMNHVYWYDNVGNITTVRDDVTRQRENFAYDPLDRLISAVPSPMTGVTATLDYTETYSYTPIGNFISKAGITQYYSNTKPHAVTSLSNGATFEYDANGNMTQRVELSGTQWVTYTQAWDVDNRMIAITSSLGYTATYTYDADGARVMKRSCTDDTFYVGSYLEKDMTHNVRMTHYYFGGQRVGMRQNNDVYWLHGDHLGSASLTTNITGAVVSEMRYYPFGETRWVSGTLPTDRLFTGQRVEAGTGLYDYNARMYSPMLGRFISADTIVPKPGNPQELNRFSYVRNRPVNLIDPSGHCGTTPTGEPICTSESSTVSALIVSYATFEERKTYMGTYTPQPGAYAIADYAIPGYIETRSKVFSQMTASDIALALGREIPIPVTGGVEAAHVTACRSGACSEYDETKAFAGGRVKVPVIGAAEIGGQYTTNPSGSRFSPYVSARVGPELGGASLKLTMTSLDASVKFVGGGGGIGLAWQLESHKLLAIPETNLRNVNLDTLGDRFGRDYLFAGFRARGVTLQWMEGFDVYCDLNSSCGIVNGVAP